ncbi:hypothetical protein ROE7235_02234 [Roseibaca ekhonensis]|uniref:Uncharacterized protein n=1 Tax=Roseinatronobacter ekhonensis TaxID=254356 RepID=A0A3B0M965_9RHOB|nr:hypothetical protein [Roseibaca ekhonensis]SUZ32475.1 hypothetical protein ROE7235_02234 [Roseibaca ekhonensis]
MKHILAHTAFLIAMALATQASAQCFADYKAKQDNPLRLQYGLIELPASACGSIGAATRYAAPVIARSGWTLLQIESFLTQAQFDARSANAGAIHLRR